ncbi:MAG: HlyD family secretion protein [Maricaulaceae bacterium]|jgi:membrane fusion protein (multidrug efflux system)
MPEDAGNTSFAREAETASASQAPSKPKRRPFGRALLMLALPLLIAGGALVLWVTGGRYISTDNAYLRRPVVTISAEVGGPITEVFAIEGDMVEAGVALFTIDPDPYALALAEAEAALATAVSEVERARAEHQSALAEVVAAEDDRAFRAREFERQQELSNRGVAAASQFDAFANALNAADQRLVRAHQDVAAARAALAGDPDIATADHPLVRAAQARADRAALDLARTEVRAPNAGMVAQADRLDAGEYVDAGEPVLALVGADRVWIEAQYKEAHTTNMRPGQPVTIKIDAYPDLELTGAIESIGAATNAEFALLPAQNATGNWVKVVQWVPVRIVIDDVDEIELLRGGLSARATVDTGQRRGFDFFGR